MSQAGIFRARISVVLAVERLLNLTILAELVNLLGGKILEAGSTLLHAEELLLGSLDSHGKSPASLSRSSSVGH